MRKDNFATVILPHDKWLGLIDGPNIFTVEETVGMVAEQVMVQARHGHGPADIDVVDLEPELCQIKLTCRRCKEVVWSCKVAYPPAGAGTVLREFN